MAVRHHILVALLVLAACGGTAPPPKKAAVKPTPAAAPTKPADQAQAPTPAAGEKLAEVTPTIEYAYSPVGKRDPFRSAIDEKTLSSEGPERPDCGPLCKWELEQLKLVAVISGVSNPIAMVEDPTGRGFIVRRGTFVGKRNGKVTQIRAGEVIVTEIYKDQMGKPHVNPVPIKIPPDEKPGETDSQNLLAPEVSE